MKNLAKIFFWAVFSFGLVSAAGLTAGGIFLSMTEERAQAVQEPVKTAAETVTLPPKEEEDEPSLSDTVERALPSVVGISSAPGKDASASGFMGSGVIASADGYIITNQHVIGSGYERIAVTLHDGTTREAGEIWSDSSLDLAVIKIEGSGYAAARLAGAGELRPGDSVIAIGNPLSMQFERTVTAGIVSAVGRTITVDGSGVMDDLIQTDASINPGNSGGPLLTSDGGVVGINTIKVPSAEGLGFAVPIDLCVPVLERIRRTGEFVTPYLGLYAITADAARYLGRDESFSRGLCVVQLDPSGPAYAAGLRYGDIIMYADGAEVSSMLDLRRTLFTHQPGETVRLSYMRGKTLRDAAATLSAAP